MANRQEIKALSDVIRQSGLTVGISTDAEVYANALDIMPVSIGSGSDGLHGEVLLLQTEQQSKERTWCVLRYSTLADLLARVKSADLVLARGA